jgi:hypothetical protein
MRPNIKGMSLRAVLLSFIVATPIFSYSQGCDMNAQVSSNLPPLLGTMAGLKLAFPRIEVGGAYYTAASVHYGDDKDWWGGTPKKRSTLPTQQSIIRDFYIGLNRKTFRPVCSKEDLYSYAGPRLYGDTNLPPESSRWLEFVFSPLIYAENDGHLRHLYEKQIALSDRLLGPLHLRQDAFGLRQRSSDREASPLAGTQATEVYDTWYFDDKSWNTLISCARGSTNKTANKITCVHYFVVPEFKAMVYARYFVIADVSDWKHIEHEVRKLALSYIVSDPAP